MIQRDLYAGRRTIFETKIESFFLESFFLESFFLEQLMPEKFVPINVCGVDSFSPN